MDKVKIKESRQCPKCGSNFKQIHPEQIIRCQTCGYFLGEEKKNEES